jgi:hypothetical protein
MEENNQWKTKVLILGGLGGLILGLFTAFLYVRNRPDGAKSEMTSSQRMNLGFGLAALIKQIIESGK